MVFFYLVTAGWIFDISLCENSINQLINQHITESRVIVGNFPAVKLLPWWAEAVIWRFTAIYRFYRLRQSRYRQKTINRLPPNNYHRLVLPPKYYRHTLVLPPPPKSLPPKITAVWYYRPKSTAMSEWSEGIAMGLSRYPITGVQTHAGTIFSRHFSNETHSRSGRVLVL